MNDEVVFRLGAEADLDAIYEHISKDSPERAIRYIRRIRARCADLAEFPEAGRARPDFGPGFRTVAFERRVLIIYAVAERIEIVRVLYGGRDVEGALPPR